MNAYAGPLLLNLVLQTIAEHPNDEDTWNHLSTPTVPHDLAQTLAPGLEPTIESALENWRLSPKLHNRILSKLEDTALSACEHIPLHQSAALV